MTITLEAKKREGRADMVRAEGLVPAVVYGAEVEPMSIAIHPVVFDKVYQEAGESTIIDLTIEGEKESTQVIIQDIQADPVKDTPLHVDFKRIKAGEEMTALVELEFVGDAPAVKEHGGTLVRSMDAVNVKCLPQDLISSIEIDLSGLTELDAHILVGDITPPNGVTITDNKDTLVVKIASPKSTEELEAEDATGSVSIEDIAVEEKGKKEEDENTASGESK